MWPGRPQRRAASMIEVLVVVGLVGLLAALLCTGASAVRQRGGELRCVANLKSIGEFSQIFAIESHRRRLPAEGARVMDLPAGLVHPQSAAGERDWIGLGGWDSGGGDGVDPPYGEPASEGGLGASGRPLNAPGGAEDGGAAHSTFRCPADRGLIDAEYPRDGSAALLRSAFEARGTSYPGNLLWTRSGNTALRHCTFMRPVTWIPSAGETILFAEARFWQAWMHSDEFSAGGAVDVTPRRVDGWHGRGSRFNAVFADGHATGVSSMKTGDVHPIAGYDPEMFPQRQLMARGRSGWRVDCFPGEWIVERMEGNP